MKKSAAILCTAMLCIPLCTLHSSAADSNFTHSFFPDGALPAPPSAPTVSYRDRNADGKIQCGQTLFFYEVPKGITAFCDAITSMGEEAFQQQYGASFNDGIYIQVDAKFDDGAWLSANGDWDVFDYGENIDHKNENFRLYDIFWQDDSSKIHCFSQSFLAYFSSDTETHVNDFLMPYIKQDSTKTYYFFDIENHTVSYRYRFYLTYTDTASNEDHTLFSDWSAETSIGKDAENIEFSAPTEIEAPVLSDFSLKEDEYGYCNAFYHMDVPKSVFESQRYFIIEQNCYDPYTLESQIRVDGGEWTDFFTINGGWLGGTVRSTSFMEDSPMTLGSDVEIRVRLVCKALGNMTSEWSNSIGNVPIDGENLKGPSADLTELPPAPDEKCSLCGICPVQPLGICLFVWIGIAVVAVAAVVCIAVKSRHKKNSSAQEK